MSEKILFFILLCLSVFAIAGCNSSDDVKMMRKDEFIQLVNGKDAADTLNLGEQVMPDIYNDNPYRKIPSINVSNTNGEDSLVIIFNINESSYHIAEEAETVLKTGADNQPVALALYLGGKLTPGETYKGSFVVITVPQSKMEYFNYISEEQMYALYADYLGDKYEYEFIASEKDIIYSGRGGENIN